MDVPLPNVGIIEGWFCTAIATILWMPLLFKKYIQDAQLQNLSEVKSYSLMC